MRHALGVLVALFASLAPRALPAQEATKQGSLETMSLDELFNVRIVSASNAAEELPEAPATVIVITREELRQRGYHELSEILDDLPGMNVVRPMGATYFKDYWRGYRNTIGEPFLLLLDGLVMNHLYFNTADSLAALPLANVERIEVVYGPASSVYGPNAFMGVINVITRARAAASGASQSGRLSLGSFESRSADLTLAYQSGDLRATLTGRFDDGELDPASGARYEYTRARYYGDRRLWGGFVDNPNLGGAFSSPHRHRAFDLRVDLSGVELGAQYLDVRSGYGLEYAADRAQSHAVWSRPELSLFLRGRRSVNERLSSTSLLRFRRSDVGNDSYFVESLPGAADGRPVQLVDFSYWHVFNTSFSLYQDFEWKPTKALSFTAGLKYEQKDLQKAYNQAFGPSLPPEQIDASRYPYPAPTVDAPEAPNRIDTRDHGIYGQGRWRLSARHQLNVGFRYDHNSQYGSAPTLRAGYVGAFGRFRVKALYGEAFQEPNPRVLYGGWSGSGSDPNLKPERSRTVELSGAFTGRRLSGLAALYRVRNRDTIVNAAGGAMNLGERSVIGLDLHGQALLHPRGLKQVRLWGYYSRLITAHERLNRPGESAEIGIGDLAKGQLHLGATALVDQHLWATLRGRRIGARPTVETNPVGRVAAYTTLDLSIGRSDVFAKGIGLSLEVANLTGTRYFHPGVREASAGSRPGAFSQSGAWLGSGGFYSSLLPQPGRALTASLLLEF